MGKKTEHIKVGYVCHKGHAVLYGDPDDCCRSKAVADIVIKPRKGYDHSGMNYPAVAEDLAATVNEALTLLDKKRWEDYEASQKKKEEETP